MAVTINSNIRSLKAQGELGRNTAELQRVYTRLSSGLHINSASDDPAGLSVASQLNIQNRVSSTAIRNVSDGISLLSVAESGLQSLSSIVGRMHELAAQAASGQYGSAQRFALDRESTALY